MHQSGSKFGTRYVVLEWPESQWLYDIEDWEEHCYLVNDVDGMNKFGSSAYFVEEEWLTKNFREYDN